jgi:hypothetical protein
MATEDEGNEERESDMVILSEGRTFRPITLHNIRRARFFRVVSEK